MAVGALQAHDDVGVGSVHMQHVDMPSPWVGQAKGIGSVEVVSGRIRGWPVSFGRRLIAAAAAFVLAIVTVMAVRTEARHAASATFLAHEIGHDATHDLASDEGNAGDRRRRESAISRVLDPSGSPRMEWRNTKLRVSQSTPA
jgi:hypothetical protein